VLYAEMLELAGYFTAVGDVCNKPLKGKSQSPASTFVKLMGPGVSRVVSMVLPDETAVGEAS